MRTSGAAERTSASTCRSNFTKFSWNRRIYALEAGVEGVVILDGKVPHAVLLALLTDHGAGC
jgi:acetylglutamate kinase